MTKCLGWHRWRVIKTVPDHEYVGLHTWVHERCRDCGKTRARMRDGAWTPEELQR